MLQINIGVTWCDPDDDPGKLWLDILHADAGRADLLRYLTTAVQLARRAVVAAIILPGF